MENSLYKDIKKLLGMKADDVVVINNYWRCKFSGLSFSGWKQDINSPSLVSESFVTINDNGNNIDGCISILKDDSLNDSLYAMLYIKEPFAEKWEKMLNVISIEFLA